MTKRLYDSSFKDVEDENFKKLCDWRIPCEDPEHEVTTKRVSCPHPWCSKTFTDKLRMNRHYDNAHGTS